MNERQRIRELLESSRTIAVIGANPKAGRPANYVPAYLAEVGYDVRPVNAQHAGTELFDRPVAASLADLDAAVDIVNVFRRSEDVPGHLEDILALDPQPKAVWLQLGIRNDDVARDLEERGIEVIQDRCILVEHRALAGS